MGIFGSIGGGIDAAKNKSDAHDQAKDARKRGALIFGLDPDNPSLLTGGGLFGSRQQYINQSRKVLTKGYQRANKQLRSQGRQSIREAKEGGKQAQSAMEQSLAQRGLTNTTVLDNATRGISSDVSRQVADIRESVSQLQAGLTMSAMGSAMDHLGQAQSVREQTAWDRFKFTVGSAGYAPGTTNAFGFGSPYSEPAFQGGMFGPIGGAIDSGIAAAMMMSGGPAAASAGGASSVAGNMGYTGTMGGASYSVSPEWYY